MEGICLGVNIRNALVPVAAVVIGNSLAGSRSHLICDSERSRCQGGVGKRAVLFQRIPAVTPCAEYAVANAHGIADDLHLQTIRRCRYPPFNAFLGQSQRLHTDRCGFTVSGKHFHLHGMGAVFQFFCKGNRYFLAEQLNLLRCHAVHGNAHQRSIGFIGHIGNKSGFCTGSGKGKGKTGSSPVHPMRAVLLPCPSEPAHFFGQIKFCCVGFHGHVNGLAVNDFAVCLGCIGRDFQRDVLGGGDIIDGQAVQVSYAQSFRRCGFVGRAGIGIGCKNRLINGRGVLIPCAGLVPDYTDAEPDIGKRGIVPRCHQTDIPFSVRHGRGLIRINGNRGFVLGSGRNCQRERGKHAKGQNHGKNALHRSFHPHFTPISTSFGPLLSFLTSSPEVLIISLSMSGKDAKIGATYCFFMIFFLSFC